MKECSKNLRLGIPLRKNIEPNVEVPKVRSDLLNPLLVKVKLISRLINFFKSTNKSYEIIHDLPPYTDYNPKNQILNIQIQLRHLTFIFINCMPTLDVSFELSS